MIQTFTDLFYNPNKKILLRIKNKPMIINLFHNQNKKIPLYKSNILQFIS